MDSRVAAIQAGLVRGRIEFRHNAGQAFSYIFFPVIALIILHFLSSRNVSDTDTSIGTWAIPGVLAMNVVFTGLVGLAMALIMERDDGTLLRAKATPNGVLGYLTGKVAGQATMSIATLLIVLIPASFLFDGLHLGSVSPWMKLAGVLILGMAATLPFGAILGSLFINPRNFRFVTLLFMGLVGISGVFYPLTTLPPWVQWIGQAFPLYWIGLGMRSAILPDALSDAESGASWHHVEMISVLGAWAIIGFVTAPAVLRRMARRESGTRLATSNETSLKRST
ncbi:ABC transporter permease [Nocardiopsis rhodophaea]|uniref:ABC transporter permease n=1 Tax=Nocardiopsis rhodophaea TaxID=280238 RepID=UPI0031DE621B